MSSVWAVVVTHNRKDKLRVCLAALAGQQRPPDHVLVVDNASSDGTPTMLDREYPAVEVLRLAANEGGAGGFHEGMKHAHAQGAEWLWLMDDDTIPDADALDQLLAASTRIGTDDHDDPSADHGSAPALLASKVLWRDGNVHPMNFPTLDRRRTELAIAGATRGVLPMRSATFVSLLVNRGAIDRHHLPWKHYFLWSDDIEYTSRVVLGGDQAWFVPASVVLHDTPGPDDCFTAPPSRFYYHVRNTLLMAQGPGRPVRDRLLRLWVMISTSVVYLRANRDRQSVAAIARGVWDALRHGADARR